MAAALQGLLIGGWRVAAAWQPPYEVFRASRGRDIAAACGQLRHEGRAPAGA